MENVYIIGSGMIRFNKYPEKTVRTMAKQAISLCLEDACINKKDLQAGFFSNTFWGMFSGQHSIRGQVVFRDMGIDKIPVTNVENACAGASTALNLAFQGIRAGMFDLAIAVGSEKITDPDKMKSFSAYSCCMDVENFEGHIHMITEMGNSFENLKIPDDDSAPGQGRSVFMDAYAMGTRWHMNKYNSTQHQQGNQIRQGH